MNNQKIRQKSAQNAQKNKLNIFDMAKKLEQQINTTEQASKILNAYRKVEDIKVYNPPKPNIKNNKSATGSRVVSQYSNKVKQTLREMNVNRSKQFKQHQSKNKTNIESIRIDNDKRNATQKHLMSRASQKLFNILCKKYQTLAFGIFTKIVGCAQNDEEMLEKYEYRIKLWKMRRIFTAWFDEIMLNKIQRARKQKQIKNKEKKQMKLAADFHYFLMIKKCMKSWKIEAKKAKRNREIQSLEADQAKKEREQLIKEILNEPTVQTKKNTSQLQNKLQGFLKNLQQQVHNKDRLNTIKEKTEQSQKDMHLRGQKRCEESIEEQNNSQQLDEQEKICEVRQQYCEPVSAQENRNMPLNNEQLQKRRNQLAEKAKNRKKMLEKVKKEKQQKKRREEEERVALEKQIEEQEKRKRQEQYRKFMKNKREQEQWEIKQLQLLQRAQQFNRIRIINYYGWRPWKTIKSINAEKFTKMGECLNKIVLKRSYQRFLSVVEVIADGKLKKLQQKADIYRAKCLKKKVLKSLNIFKREQLELKEQLMARHEINIQKIFLGAWKRAQPILQVQNYEWERPRIKKAEYFHAINLLHKSWQAIAQNKQSQIQTRRIAQHRKVISEKVQSIVEQKPTINYEQFL